MFYPIKRIIIPFRFISIIVIKSHRKEPNQSIGITGLQVVSSDAVDPHNALDGSRGRQVLEDPWRHHCLAVGWKRVHVEGALWCGGEMWLCGVMWCGAVVGFCGGV